MIYLHNFTGVYEIQDFYKKEKHLVLNNKNLSGVRGYMDEETKLFLTDLLKREVRICGIHFLDSGNYHHMSYLYTSLIQKPFQLIVYDNHTDMQTSAFGKILSCGSWILEALEENSFLKKVTMVGVKEKYQKECSFLQEDRVYFVNSVEEIEVSNERLPAYLSIDKDVLSEEEFVADWDQGEMSLYTLIKELKFIKKNYNLIGIDVCGEPLSSDLYMAEASSRINLEILKVMRSFSDI